MSQRVICIDNNGNETSVIVGKVYETLKDRAAAEHSMLRVLHEDTSEPNRYLCSAKMFAQLEVPETVKRRPQRYRLAAGV